MRDETKPTKMLRSKRNAPSRIRVWASSKAISRQDDGTCPGHSVTARWPTNQTVHLSGRPGPCGARPDQRSFEPMMPIIDEPTSARQRRRDVHAHKILGFPAPGHSRRCWGTARARSTPQLVEQRLRPSGRRYRRPRWASNRLRAARALRLPTRPRPPEASTRSGGSRSMARCLQPRRMRQLRCQRRRCSVAPISRAKSCEQIGADRARTRYLRRIPITAGFGIASTPSIPWTLLGH